MTRQNVILTREEKLQALELAAKEMRAAVLELMGPDTYEQSTLYDLNHFVRTVAEISEDTESTPVAPRPEFLF